MGGAAGRYGVSYEKPLHMMESDHDVSGSK